jgi:guanosine-3',5'-bis(diphosphate) 3'-pyrophosphohydrolase
MDRVAENGVAAHWIYKSAGVEVNGAQLRAREWVQRLLDMQRSTRNSIEFIENVKIDLFPDEVYVFTPKGHIMELPKGATSVDFAYAVHSDVGNRCVAAKVNRRLVPLSMPLTNGQTVEIMTSTNAIPNPAWLNFVVTGKARSNIRNFLKNQHHAESATLGRRLLDQALIELSSRLDDVPPETMAMLLQDLDYKIVDQLFYELGIGNQMPMVIAKRLVVSQDVDDSRPNTHVKPLVIKGTEGMVIEFAKCCQPIPGDNIVGRFQRGRGILVHASDCGMIKKSRVNPDHFVSMRWDDDIKGEFWVDITVDVANQRGVLAQLTTIISENESNIGNITVEPGDSRHKTVTFVISVMNRDHLATIMRRFRAHKLVLRLYRKKKGE